MINIRSRSSKKGYSNGEIIAITIISCLIVLLTVIYMKQSSQEAYVSGIKEKVKIEAKRVIDTISKDVTSSKKGSMDIVPYGKTGAKIIFQVLDKGCLVPIFYVFERPKLVRHDRGKEKIIGEHVSGLKINEDFNTGDMEIEVSILVTQDLEIPIAVNDKAQAKMLNEIPEDVKVLTEDGVDVEFENGGGGGTAEVESTNLEIFSQYVNQSMIELKQNKIRLETEVESIKKREFEVNKDLSSATPGIKHSTYPLFLPGIRDQFVLDEASRQPAIDQKYVEHLKSKAEIIANMTKLLEELRIVNSIINQRDKKK